MWALAEISGAAGTTMGALFKVGTGWALGRAESGVGTGWLA